MADEEVVEGEEKKKGGLVKVLLFVIIGILLIAMSIGGTLFLTGAFDAKPIVVDEDGNVITQEVTAEGVEGADLPPTKKAALCPAGPPPPPPSAIAVPIVPPAVQLVPSYSSVAPR